MINTLESSSTSPTWPFIWLHGPIICNSKFVLLLCFSLNFKTIIWKEDFGKFAEKSTYEFIEIRLSSNEIKFKKENFLSTMQVEMYFG